MKNKKSVIILIISMCVLAVLSIGLLAKDAVIASVSPTTYLGMAAANTVKQMNKELEINSSQGLKLFNVQKEGLDLEANMQLVSVDGEKVKDVSSELANMRTALSVKAKGEDTLAQLSLKSGSNTLFELGIFENLTQMGIKLDPLYSKYLSVNKETFAKDFNDSALKDLMGVEAIDESFNLNKETEEVDALVIDDLKEILKELAKLGKVTNEGKEKIDNKSCKNIQVLIDGDTAEDLLLDAVSTVMDDANVKASLRQIIKMDYYYYSDEDIEEELKTMKKDLRDAIKEMNISDEVIFNFYINSKEHIVQVDFETTIEPYGEKGKVTATLNIGGEKYLTDLCEFEGQLKTSSGKITVNTAAESNYGMKEDEKYSNISGAIKVDDEAIGFKVNTAYNPKEQEDNCELEAEFYITGDMRYALEAKGTVLEDRKAKAVTFDFGKIEVSAVDEYYGDQGAMVLSLEGECRSLQETDFMPSKMEDLLAMSKSELTGLVTEMGMNLYDFSNQIDDLLYY